MKTGVKYSVIWLFFLFCYIEASFRCDYKYSAAAKGWFKHIVIPSRWTYARLRCTLEGATLASPLNSEMQDEMKQIVNDFFTNETEIFTGLHTTFSKGQFFYSIEGVPLSRIPITWAENEPNNLKSSEKCITFNADGELADRSCDKTLPYICYRSSAKEMKANECGTVDPEYTLYPRTGSCYKFHTVPRTFIHAQFACSAEGGHLAIINSDFESQVLKNIFAKYDDRKLLGPFKKNIIFVGFHDWGQSQDWRTIHGQSLKEAGFARFFTGEPNNLNSNEHCGSMYRNGFLNDMYCETPLAFICEKKPNFPAVCSANAQEPAFDLVNNV